MLRGNELHPTIMLIVNACVIWCLIQKCGRSVSNGKLDTNTSVSNTLCTEKGGVCPQLVFFPIWEVSA